MSPIGLIPPHGGYRQLKSLEQEFLEKGGFTPYNLCKTNAIRGFTERLYQSRKEKRGY